MNKLPLVSVVMITYGHENYIEEAINGVLFQDCDFEIELIISNDCSPDNTDAVVNKICQNHPKANIINYIKQEQNIGIMPNFLQAIKQCKGKYIALCEGDDFWTDANKLQKQVDFLESNNEYVVVYHDVNVVDSSSQLLDRKILTDEIKKDFTGLEMQKGAFIMPMTMCFRNIISDYPSEMYEVLNGDTFLISILGQYGNGKYFDTIKPSSYRVHSGGIWSSNNELSKIKNKRNTYKKLAQYHKRINNTDVASFFVNTYQNCTENYLTLSLKSKNRIEIIKAYACFIWDFKFKKMVYLHKIILNSMLRNNTKLN